MKVNKYWFRPKSYGYGYSPITWEGGLMVVLVLVLILISTYINNFFNIETPPDTRNGFRLILDLTLIILSLNPVMEKRTNEEVKWNWGKK